MKLSSSPMTQHIAFDKPFYLKRDDLLHPQFSGNKARKFMELLNKTQDDIKILIGHGSPQANSLYSLAALAWLKGWKFEFYVANVASFIKQSPKGNYGAALDLGAQIIELSQLDVHKDLSCYEYIQNIRRPDKHCLVVPEGGRCAYAKYGVTQLAKEILSWINTRHILNPVVSLPSGTGTTALYLHQYLSRYGIEVLTCACVGGHDYLVHQFKELLNDANETNFPTILDTGKKHHFGKLYREDFEIWKQLQQQTGVEFDLLYDPTMWQCLQKWIPENRDKSLIYIHQGGLLGNTTMHPRYQRKFEASLCP